VVEGFCPNLERVRLDYGVCVDGHVVMPEHVHLLLNEPERNTLAQAIKVLKQGVARRLALRGRRFVLAGSVLRFQCVEREEICGEAAIHSSESGEAGLG
jgi:REP element-mobilizing transposase RayT